ncbi:hypothetical protein, partial [Victivallis vadensis]|uniref:hypothetical protein n=1 Tax=Victivallis vadensis TaxID=172901 RepID=UPI0023F27DF8
VVSAANDEELTGAARQVSGKAAPANGSASQVNGRSEASGRAIVHAAGGQALKKALQSHPQMTGTQFMAGNDTERRIKRKYNYYDHVRLESGAEAYSPQSGSKPFRLRTPGAVPDGR